MEKRMIDNKNTEVNIGVCMALNSWLVGFSWWHTNDVMGNRNTILSFDVLCFHFWIELWRWSDEEVH